MKTNKVYGHPVAVDVDKIMEIVKSGRHVSMVANLVHLQLYLASFFLISSCYFYVLFSCRMRFSMYCISMTNTKTLNMKIMYI